MKNNNLITGSWKKFKIGDKLMVSGPSGVLAKEAITLPGIIIEFATFEDWKNQEPKLFFKKKDIEILKKANYYQVSVD